MSHPARHRASVSLISASLLAFSSLGAQQSDSTSRDSVVQAGRPRAELPAVVVTGTLSAFAPEKLGMSRSVIDAAQLRAEPARSAVDALRRTTGVFIDEAVGPLGPTIIRLRGGEETFTQVMMDGVPINENGGFMDALGITVVNVDRIDIARGPQSALYGSSAISGVVHLFTRSGEPGRMQMEASVEAGRAERFGGSARGNVLASGGSDRARYSLGVGTAYNRGQYALPNDVRSHDASLRADFHPTSALVITPIMRLLAVDAMQPVRNPGVTRAPLDPNQRQARDRLTASLAGAWRPSSAWTHNLSISRFRRDFTYEDQRDGLDQSQFPNFVFDANFRYDAELTRTIARYVSSATRHAARVGGALAFGAEWESESLDDRQSGDFGASTMSVNRPGSAAFGEGQLRLADRVSVLMGARWQKYRELEAEMVPRATAVVDVLRDRLSVRYAVSRAYKAPNIQDQFPSSPFIVANPDLQPETSHSWETGLDIELPAWNTRIGTTYFQQRFDNLIRSVNYDDTGRQINRNLGRSRAAGFEASIATTPRDRWSLGAEGAWSKTRVVDNNGLPSTQFPNGEELPFRPAHTATAFVGFPVRSNVAAVIRGTALGRQTVLSDRFRGTRESVEPYEVFGGTVTWNASSSLDLYAQIENLLDTHFDVAYDRPGLRRTYLVGARLRR